MSIEEIKKNTRRFAKRQITWLRSMSDRLIVPCDAPDALAQVLRLVRTARQAPSP